MAVCSVLRLPKAIGREGAGTVGARKGKIVVASRRGVAVPAPPNANRPGRNNHRSVPTSGHSPRDRPPSPSLSSSRATTETLVRGVCNGWTVIRDEFLMCGPPVGVFPERGSSRGICRAGEAQFGLGQVPPFNGPGRAGSRAGRSAPVLSPSGRAATRPPDGDHTAPTPARTGHPCRRGPPRSGSPHPTTGEGIRGCHPARVGVR